MADYNHITLGSMVVGLVSMLSGITCSQICEPQQLTSPHSVHAYSEQPMSCLSGCVAASPNTQDPEVHIINLRSSTPPLFSTSSSQLNPQNTIDFNFKSKQGGILARNLVFVLNSAAAVLWRVKGENIFPIPLYDIKIVVPHNTSVTWNSEISINLIETALPQDNTNLLNFVQEHYDSAATFSEVLDANAFTLLVGAGIKTPSICVISPGFQTLDFTAKHVVEQPITGCEVQETLGSLQPEFHIILLHAGSGAQSSASVPVLVEIKFGRSSDNMADIILVLVAEGNVTWRVQTGLRSGMLQVVSPNLVDVEEDLLNAVDIQEVPRTSEGLLAWAATRDWPVTSFTRAESANKFVVMSEHQNTPTREPASRLKMLQKFTVIKCHRSGIQVRILQSVMSVYGLNAENMMLRDRSCGAVESGPYYVIDTQKEQCGSEMTLLVDGEVLFNNEVIYTNSESVMEGSGELDRDRLMGGPPIDDEQGLSYTVPINCKYLTNGDPVTSSLPNQVTISMDMYTGNDYRQKVQDYPHSVQVGERVYLEVSLRSDTQLNIVPKQCWLSLPGEEQLLIQQGCAMTESLIFHRGSSNSDQMRRFSFEIPDTVFVKWPYNVHCVLGMCSRNGLDGIGVDKEIPQCTSIQDPVTGCLNPLHADSMLTQAIYLGPFQIVTSSIVTPSKEDTDIPKAVEGTGCKELTSQAKDDCQVDGLATGPAVAIVVVSFIMGMVLMGALWFIHTHTGPHTGPPPSASPGTVSTASSPSANGHLMNGHIPNGAIPNGVIPNGVIPNGTIPNGNIPSGFMPSKLNPNGIPLHGMRHVDPLPEEV
ncbi:transforming growth factor beta receptor type 3-like isoform X1 [Asterias amurensis]|uniref:transforming growth factor beta receptor type 3-like isoform X1 n=1 Tax=Asterias amurensis TaxID=7602 RepID=UPI003AB8FD35